MIEQLQWISAGERLPDAEASVLLWLRNHDGGEDWAAGHWTGEHWLLDWCGAEPQGQVVVWAEPRGPGETSRPLHGHHGAPGAWQPIATAPTTGRKVILAYVNRNGKPRTVMARWLTDEQAAERDGDGVGLEGGWYECIDNWDDYTEVAIYQGEPTHWMPLPAPPVNAEITGSQRNGR